ncbi:MAG: hypothetical protein II317_05395 [Clostridia bacterium]|nr:hypothetical protein [Clostridia bacterium]MBQ2237519.1 hypothetical protein [Clostridia bacterium]MEE1185029.1 YerC/YecD family TrpR-related protein [Acutalibacteraceae bacterium]
MCKNNKKSIERLYKAILSLENKKECENFFDDICTVQEILALAQRFEVACELQNGKNYTEVNKLTGASTATICRVSRCLNYGNGGYKKVIERLEKEGN